MNNYERYPIHCLYSGTIISTQDYNRLRAEDKKNWAKTSRDITYTLKEDKRGQFFEKIQTLNNEQ